MLVNRILALILSGSLTVSTAPIGFAGQTEPAPDQSPTPVVKQTPAQLQQLVAPIALYPDELVAEVLAAATYPTQIVEAKRWLQDHKDLQGKQLGDEVDKQNWDSSVKAMTEFPSVLANMDKNLSWTSSLGDAYVNQQQEVMDAVQVMRQHAQASGNLSSNSQEKVEKKDKTIVIEPVNPDTVYVPEYDPWIVYGAPLGVWPGWYWYPGLYVTTPGIFFGVGFGLGFFGGFGWGWGHWGFDWGHGRLLFDHRGYISHSRTFGRGGFGGHGFARGGSSHGFAGTHSGAFSGFNNGGVARGNSFGGRSSFGGFHGGGAGHGGGGHR